MSTSDAGQWLCFMIATEKELLVPTGQADEWTAE